MTAYRLDNCADAPVIQTTSGKVRGRWQTGCSAAYLGIPFAAAPVGDRRFAAPVRPAPWQGVRPAVEYGPTPQRRPFGPVTTVPEPCIPGDETLNVNVFTPAPRDHRAHLPVLVWIHGGGYFAGSPASPWYNGRAFNSRGVVTVTLSYRLGFDGFGWMEGAPLNRGLLDQIAALTWVQENIEAFGGDPHRVTIAGQSAGGGCVLALLASPKAAGLFHGAISESGAFGAPTAQQAETVGRALAQQVGVKPEAAAWREVPESRILDSERQVNSIAGIPAGFSKPEELLSALAEGFLGTSNLAFAPVLDGEVLLQQTPQAVLAGQGAQVALLMGSTRNEFTFSSPPEHSLPLQAAVCALQKAGLPAAAVSQFADDIYRVGEDCVLGQLMTVYMFRIGIAHLAQCRCAAGCGGKTWLYDFAQLSSEKMGSFHCEDIPYFFHLLDAPGVAQELGKAPSEPLADVMHSKWVEFITNGCLAEPTAAQFPCGAVRFEGSDSFQPDAYLLESSLLTAAGQTVENPS
ncbi:MULTISPECIES: carboxylesterase/lipase family protein [Caproicibacterium]|uniref:Carboxylic ester hydrolase n=1 Tax=Caproicibacterium argilliputei TaxID=3030016 RepID=A0AA97DB82_9FIRM|nr:carboxylesterase family protein [Caproicibacterium argilliputei]WOC33204.1 carboxylesterase family protein [Caproicibacterium argilliputei]